MGEAVDRGQKSVDEEQAKEGREQSRTLGLM